MNQEALSRVRAILEEDALKQILKEERGQIEALARAAVKKALTNPKLIEWLERQALNQIRTNLDEDYDWLDMDGVMAECNRLAYKRFGLK